jgi:hypothetical protein
MIPPDTFVGWLLLFCAGIVFGGGFALGGRIVNRLVS